MWYFARAPNISDWDARSLIGIPTELIVLSTSLHGALIVRVPAYPSPCVGAEALPVLFVAAGAGS
jgi:hypothetical protein